MPMLVQASLQDRQSSSKNNGQQHDSVSSDELAGRPLNRTTLNIPNEIAPLKTGLGDISQRLDRIENSRSSDTIIQLLKAIHDKLLAPGTSADDLIPQGNHSSLSGSLDKFSKSAKGRGCLFKYNFPSEGHPNPSTLHLPRTSKPNSTTSYHQLNY